MQNQHRTLAISPTTCTNISETNIIINTAHHYLYRSSSCRIKTETLKHDDENGLWEAKGLFKIKIISTC